MNLNTNTYSNIVNRYITNKPIKYIHEISDYENEFSIFNKGEIIFKNNRLKAMNITLNEQLKKNKYKK